MNYGYPGSNTHLENHNVSEEGFWPSFTDIMMVIVMVFLIVTVAVILNNWSLIADLKTSINAQQIASNLADNRQTQNKTLTVRLATLEEQLAALNSKYQVEKASLAKIQEKLTNTAQNLTEKSDLLMQAEVQLKTLSSQYEIEKSNVLSANEKLANTQKKLASSEELMKDKESLIVTLKTDLASSNNSLKEERSASKQFQRELTSLQASLEEKQQSEQELHLSEQTLAQQLDDKSTELMKLTASVDTSQQQLKDKEAQIAQLKQFQEEANDQLKSLQGEYDTLDSKYQKLLRPARSSKGKYIASVTYKKSGGKKVIRLKANPNGSYKSVSPKQLAKELSRLKKKHHENLYIKVIIPEKSGLSFNEAWKFTNQTQKRYDYYYQ